MGRACPNENENENERTTGMSPLFTQWQPLVEEVHARWTNQGSQLHGPDHWKRVAWTGAELLEESRDADPEVVFLFALFHDAMRLNDDYDPDHGRRAGVFARRLHGTLYTLREAQLDLLVRACDGHADGRLSRNPTVAVCWDADRLNLWRVGVRPKAEFLSTPAGARESRILAARALQERALVWEEVAARFARLADGIK